MSETPPMVFRWDGEGMMPLGRYVREADKHFVVGERYQMEVIEQRSVAAHRFYFARINELWASLPEKVAPQYPSPKHLRKRSLIAAGYCTEQHTAATSRDQAERIAALVQAVDEYCLVVVNDDVVTAYKAESQSRKAMGKERFQQSIDDVLAVIEEMVGLREKARA